MAIQSFKLDPNAAAYTDDEIIAKVNAASTQITRADAIAAAARPLGDGEVTAAKLDTGVAKANLDAMADTARGYIKTSPTAGMYKVISIERDTDGKANITYDDVAV